jgi:hypothetical protein
MTRYKIAEQILLMLKGGNIKAATSIEIEDIIESVGQYINAHFKQEQLSVNMPSGETIPEGLMLAAYGDTTPIVPVQYKGVSKITLPIPPVALPRNMGVYHVSRLQDINDGFIPLQTGQLALIKGERLISDLLGQVGYEVVGNDVIFNKDLTTENGTTIYLRLVVFDINSFDDYTNLPLPADMEATIIQECFKLFSMQMPASHIDDPSAERQPK